MLEQFKQITETIFLSTLSLRRATRGLFSSVYLGYIFLSTLSLRRATPRACYHSMGRHISIHALLAESDLTLIQKLAHLCLISIHALLAESDFLILLLFGLKKWISIHALLAESD